MLTIKTVFDLNIRLSIKSKLLLFSNIPINKVETPNIEVTYINNMVICKTNST